MKKKLLLCLIGLFIMTGCSSTEATTENVPLETTEEPAVEIQEVEPIIYGTDYESTWGDLIEANGGEPVWDTLTPAQQALVHYPKFDESNVYWVPEGSAYHAVDWCYTLSRSKTILSGTLKEALDIGHDPCSKCVGE